MKKYYVVALFACMLFHLSCQKKAILESGTTVSFEANAEDNKCGQLRTQTPGGWGAPPRGHNPASYLHANFGAAFGTLTVGCETGKKLTVTSAQTITNLLPTGGKANALSQDQINPTGIKNVLVGHLIALSLSVGFDNHDHSFASSETNLEDMIVGSGPFQGMTVKAFLDIANNIIGGCNNAYTIQQVLGTAEMINENYTDGNIDNGFLECPDNTPR